MIMLGNLFNFTQNNSKFLLLSTQTMLQGKVHQRLESALEVALIFTW